LLAIVRETLRENNMIDEEKEVSEKLLACNSYEEALKLFSEYVTII
jgi:hypothetical protein